MKKQISMLLATACAASLLAACGGSGSTAASASAADSTAASSEKTAADAASLYENAQKPDKLVWWVHDGKMAPSSGSLSLTPKPASTWNWTSLITTSTPKSWNWPMLLTRFPIPLT